MLLYYILFVIFRSEFYETLGIAQFFGARYTQCLASFETAIRIKQLGHNKELTYHRNIGRMALLVSSINYLTIVFLYL